MKNTALQLLLAIQISFGYAASNDLNSCKTQDIKLPITCDIEKAKGLAKAYKKPLVLVFTGSDWCDNSQKMLKIFQDNEFALEIKNSMIFVQVDFPELNTASKESIERNFSLKKVYGVEEFPEIVLLSEDQELITQIGFCHEGAKQLASRLQKHINHYDGLKDFLENFKSKSSTQLLKKYYLEAKSLGSEELVSKYIDKGMQTEKGIFFHMEKYSSKLAKGESDESLKKTIIKRDKKGDFKALLKLALCDFQELSKKFPDSPNEAIKPLLEYAETHGLEGEASLWKVHNLIAQHLRAKGDFEKALFHAKLSLKDAPENHQKEIKKLIKCFSHEIIASEMPEKLQIDSESPSSLQ